LVLTLTHAGLPKTIFEDSKIERNRSRDYTMVQSQDMFMLFFSILYGIMLNSVAGLGAFPFAEALQRKDLVKIDKKNGDTWEKGPITKRRLCLSSVVLNLLPFLYFALCLQNLHVIGKEISDIAMISFIQIILLDICLWAHMHSIGFS